ncbi:MAG: FkbM family methyltransferase [Oligoflexales bacterium]|nr:FkbM family methyltransferase [Oligoflexales bacterium]
MQRLFQGKTSGFYIDLGAHHPKRFSNTYLLYRLGWCGINIDAMPGAMALFKKIRKRDICLEIGISDKNETKDFYIFSERALNTFDKDLAKERIALGWRLERTQKVQLRPINSVLDEFLPPQTQIDLLTIDIEGLDGIVLKSLCFNKYRPKVIICEQLSTNVEDVSSSEIAHILKRENYVLSSKLFNSAIWKQKT